MDAARTLPQAFVSMEFIPARDRRTVLSAMLTSCISPITGHDGKFIGVVGVDISMATITEMMDAIRPCETGYASLVGPAGDGDQPRREIPDHRPAAAGSSL